jgi:hypothetical protein
VKSLAKGMFLGVMLLGVGLFSPSRTLGQIVEFLPVWTHVASACAVDEEFPGKYAFSSSDFTFKGNEISHLGVLPIVVRCNIVNPLDEGNPNWDTLIVGYRDPDGTADNHRVTVRLRRLARPTGTTSTIATFTSNSSSVTTRTENSVGFSHAWDFLKNEYYVEIELIRKNTTARPLAYMVRLAKISVIR